MYGTVDKICPPPRRPSSVFRRRESGTPSAAPQSIRPAAPVQEDSWLADAEHRIRGFAELPDDWDSYGGGPVPKSVLEAAVAIAAIMSDIGFSRPDVGPQSSGGVLLEWHHAGRTLTVDIDIAGGLSPDRGFSFAYESPGEREIEGDLEDFTGLLMRMQSSCDIAPLLPPDRRSRRNAPRRHCLSAVTPGRESAFVADP